MNFVQILSIILIAGAFVLAFGIAYLKYKENLVRIQMNGEDTKKKNSKFLLVFGIIVIGLALSLIIATIMNELFFVRYKPLVYLITMLLFTGISLVFSDRLVNK